MSSAHRLGRDAEDRAAEYLLSRGYTLVTRRYRTRGGELDLVALDGETVVFVEVKARRTGEPEDGITPQKARRLARAARTFLGELGLDGRPRRFDLVAVDDGGLRHYPGELDALVRVEFP